MTAAQMVVGQNSMMTHSKILGAFGATELKETEMTDADLLEEIRARIPVSMKSSFDFCLLQAYFAGHAAGLKSGLIAGAKAERENCIETIQELAAEALLKVVKKEPVRL